MKSYLDPFDHSVGKISNHIAMLIGACKELDSWTMDFFFLTNRPSCYILAKISEAFAIKLTKQNLI
jgi:hypothetical protein